MDKQGIGAIWLSFLFDIITRFFAWLYCTYGNGERRGVGVVGVETRIVTISLSTAGDALVVLS